MTEGGWCGRASVEFRTTGKGEGEEADPWGRLEVADWRAAGSGGSRAVAVAVAVEE